MPTDLPPSLFNDVIGPVMRGPSSSHSAASVRIARLARDLCGGTPERVVIDFDTEGSLATTHDSQGSDMGLFGGLLGWEADDPRLVRAAAAIEEAGMDLEIRIAKLDDPHPNTYRLSVERDGARHGLVALSTGGGMIEAIEIDGAPVTLYGDGHATVLDLEGDADETVAALEARGLDRVQRASDSLLVVESVEPPPEGSLRDLPHVTRVRRLAPVLPVLSPPDLAVPFLHASEMEASGDVADTRLSDRAIEYEAARGGIDAQEVLRKAGDIVRVVRGGIAEGLAGTDFEDRILPRQSHRFAERLAAGTLLAGGVLNDAILNVTALMEVKSSMGVFVAAPTAGSCGTFPGTTIAAADVLEADEEAVRRAFLAGGLIGVFVATRSSFAAEVGGCQAETGAGAAMAAAALVELAGGSAKTALSAASHALQNVLGLICDPVANRVEAPCLGRNIAGASNAIASANIALAGFDHLIPFDEVLDAHREVSESMARELRCTALGGLSITPTSKAIEARLCGEGGCGSC